MRSPNQAVEATGYRRLTADVGSKKEKDMHWDKEQIRTFAFLHSAADWALEQAESATKKVFPSMHAILASVHCLEAFTNHIGPCSFGVNWDTREANLHSPKEKLRSLFDKFKINIADVQGAYDAYMLALRIRKELTHGRTHEICKGMVSQFIDGREVTSTVPEWHKHCNPRTAKSIFDAVTDLLEELGHASGEGRYCWKLLAQGNGYPEAT